MNVPRPAAEKAPGRRRPLLGLLATIVVLVVAIDQVTKSWAVDHLRDRARPVLWTLRFSLSFNSGLAFSQGRGRTGLITIVGVLLVVGLVWWAATVTRPVMGVALGLIVGGATGNLADRLFRDHGGAVIDFIDLQWWPVFNVADMALSVGAVVLIAASFRPPRPTTALTPSTGSPPS